MYTFDDLLIETSEARISLWKKTLERIESDHVMRESYENAIAAEQRYVDYLKSLR